jgi:hypothetical protein
MVAFVDDLYDSQVSMFPIIRLQKHCMSCVSFEKRGWHGELSLCNMQQHQEAWKIQAGCLAVLV